MPTHIDVPGPAGALEAMATQSGDPDRWAVLAHPHPQYGGSMHDAVLECAERALIDTGFGVVRFNFRGVGGSEGTFDRGVGETDDCRAVMAWTCAEYNCDTILLGGYSFGANVAWRASAGATSVNKLLLIAPPLGAMPFDAEAPECPVHVFAGDQDEFIDDEVLAEWPHGKVHLIDGANHFFMGRWQVLEEAVAAELR